MAFFFDISSSYFTKTNPRIRILSLKYNEITKHFLTNNELKNARAEKRLSNGINGTTRAVKLALKLFSVGSCETGLGEEKKL